MDLIADEAQTQRSEKEPRVDRSTHCQHGKSGGSKLVILKSGIIMAATPMEETKKLNNYSTPVGLQTSEIKHYTQQALQCLPCF